MEHGMKEAFKLIRGRGFIESSMQPKDHHQAKKEHAES